MAYPPYSLSPPSSVEKMNSNTQYTIDLSAKSTTSSNKPVNKKRSTVLNIPGQRLRSAPNFWTDEECSRLQEAVNRFGCHGQWKRISSFVGTRSENQCINKWKNDLCKQGKRRRWNPAASSQLIQYMNAGLSIKAIQERMPEYTYIQIYQQVEKRKKRHDSWEKWEVERLKELKKNGVYSNSDIGALLNNRHCDDVKNMWKKIEKNIFS